MKKAIRIFEDVQIPGTDVLLEKGDRIVVLTERLTAEDLKWESFNRGDWMAYAGAERFTNGDDPFIAESINGDIFIIDAVGIQILGFDEATGNEFSWSFDFNKLAMFRGKNKAESASDGWAFAEDILERISLPLQPSNLKRLGFRKDL